MTTRELPALDGVEHRFLDVEGLRMHVALTGTRDPLLSITLMSEFGAHATDLQVQALENVGHFPATEQPAQVVERALQFLG
ncbi:hypothetical protein AB0N05_24390 [Nocardia sp. NPDC051030]|uniref:alpha/beta fold hydrolase n=1 Tax=Nocardia sp. NPDC051030 TaxID=3155162 RepID=UPI00342BC532